VLLGIATWFVLADGPWCAPWLSSAEKDQVARDRQDEDGSQQVDGKHTASVIRDCIIYFLWSSGNYGLTFWLPKILSSAGASTIATGWWGTITFGFGALALWWAGRRRSFRALPWLFLVGAAGFVIAGLSHSVELAAAGFCISAMGILAGLPMFWSLAASRLSGKAAGAAIALVNSVGAVGAFAGPSAMGWLHDATNHYSAGLWAIAGAMTLGGVLVYGESSKTAHPVAQAAD
jgi:cyanate permease